MSETIYTLSGTKLLELAYQIAGATSATFLVREPDLDFASVAEEIKDSVVKVLVEFKYDGVGSE
jgi:hypothetical protein